MLYEKKDEIYKMKLYQIYNKINLKKNNQTFKKTWFIKYKKNKSSTLNL